MKKIEKSAVPGLDRMLGMIKTVELRNRLIIAFVIALCISIILYLQFLSPASKVVVEMTEEPIKPKGIRTGGTPVGIPGE